MKYVLYKFPRVLKWTICAIVDELSCTEEYKGYEITAELCESTGILSLYTNREFNYRMHGIAMPVYGKENLLIDFGVVEAE